MPSFHCAYWADSTIPDCKNYFACLCSSCGIDPRSFTTWPRPIRVGEVGEERAESKGSSACMLMAIVQATYFCNCTLRKEGRLGLRQTCASSRLDACALKPSHLAHPLRTRNSMFLAALGHLSSWPPLWRRKSSRGSGVCLHAGGGDIVAPSKKLNKMRKR